MKKILIVLLLVCCSGVGFAQQGVGRFLGHSVQDQLVRQVTQHQIQFVSRQLRLAEELARYQRVPLKTTGSPPSFPTVLALPCVQAPRGQAAAARLWPVYDESTYELAGTNLKEYLTQLSKTEGTKFLFRGMPLTDLNEIIHILSEGLEVEKTGYERIYVAASYLTAERYAETFGGKIPVFVVMENEDVVDYLERDILFPEDGIYSSPTDIPAEAISHVFAFLEINGKLAWYRVVLQDEMIFLPLSGSLY